MNVNRFGGDVQQPIGAAASGAPPPRGRSFWLRWLGAPALVGLGALLRPVLPAWLGPYVVPVLLLYLPLLLDRGPSPLPWPRRRSGLRDVLLAGVLVLGAFWAVTRWLLWGPWHAPPGGWLDRAASELLAAAIPEELFFRGWLQPLAARRWPDGWGPARLCVSRANLATSAIFALLHLASDPRPTRLAVFFPSLWFGWTVERSGRLWPAVLLHALANLSMAAALPFPGA